MAIARQMHVQKDDALCRYRATDIVSVTIEEITPKRAERLLSIQVANRAVRASHVDRLAADMAAGAWRLTHQGIAITKDGAVVDGKHRLSAVIKSGVTVKMMVTTLAPADGAGALTAVMVPLDIGSKRTTADIIGADSRYTVNIVATLVRLHMVNGSNHSRNPQLIDRVQSILSPHLRAQREQCPSNPKIIGSAPVRAAILLRQAQGLDVLPNYRLATLLEFESLPAAWARWVGRLLREENVSGPVARERVSVLTWMVTDPTVGDDAALILTKAGIEKRKREMRDALERILSC